MSRTVMPLNQARKIALAAQGFGGPRPARKAGAAAIARVIRRLGLLQLDYVNVVTPAHYLVLYARLGAFPYAAFDRAVYRSGAFTEQWAHEASVIPMETWPLLRHRMEEFPLRPWGYGEYLDKHPEYARAVLAELEARGALTAAEVAGPPPGMPVVESAWFRSIQRITLEAHFARGAVAVARRLPNFARVYDLAHRLIPDVHHRARVASGDARRELVRIAARACGIATAADIADYFRMPVRDARPGIEALVAEGELREVSVEGWRETAYLHRAARRPKSMDACALLAPFDPVVWFRPRVARLFEFDYRFEIFVPEEKRKWGCYVFPLLLGDRLVARADIKADRAAGKLRVMAAHYEKGIDRAQAKAALNAEVRRMAEWQGLRPA